MKTVDVDFGSNSGISTVIVLRDYDDVNEYCKFLAENTMEHINELMTSDIPKSRWDHHKRYGNYGSAVNAGIDQMFVTRENALLASPGIMDRMTANIFKMINDGEEVSVNKNGGYCPLRVLRVIPNSEREFALPKRWQYTHVPGSEWINLENDPVLEEHTIQTLGEDQFSYITGFKYITDFSRVLSSFVADGGRGVYVYTTATNKAQLEDYCAVIADTPGINKVWFQINTDTTVSPDVVDNLENAGKTVTVEYV